MGPVFRPSGNFIATNGVRIENALFDQTCGELTRISCKIDTTLFYRQCGRFAFACKPSLLVSGYYDRAGACSAVVAVVDMRRGGLKV